MPEPRDTEGRRKTKTPRQLLLWFAAFFIVYGIVSLALKHRTYAFFSLALGAMWVALAYTWRDNGPTR